MSEVPLYPGVGLIRSLSLGRPSESEENGWRPCGPLHGRRVLAHRGTSEREFFIDNLMVRIHLIIVMIIVERPCAMGV